MAYTIIEVQKKTGVSGRTLRYWCDSGLFPLVERNESGVRYFSDSDIEWVGWVVCFRKMGMSIERLREYTNLVIKGQSTMSARLEMIKEEKKIVEQKLKELQESLALVNKKIEFYEQAIAEDSQTQAKYSKNGATK